MSDKVMYIHGHRMFLVPEGQDVPAGDTLVSRSDGTWHRVDLASLETHEVDIATSQAWQKEELEASMRQIGQVSEILGELLTTGRSSQGLDPGARRAGLARLKEAVEGIRHEVREHGAAAVGRKVAQAWQGPGADELGAAVTEATEALDDEEG